MVTRVALLVALVAGAAAPAAAQDAGSPAPRWGGELTLASAYVWRGDTELRGSNAQSDLWMSLGPITARSWAAIAGDGLHEHDAEFTYTRSIGALAVRGAWINYFVPSDPDARLTNDVMAGLEYDWVVSPSLSIWQGVGGAERERYVEAALASRLDRGRLGLEPRIAAGYLHEPGGVTRLSHVESTLTIEWQAGGVAMRPFVTHVAPIRAGIARRTYGGLAVGLD